METPAVSAVLSQPDVGENQPAITPRPEPPAALGRRAAERMDVSVLICTYNRRQLLGATLDSLAAMHVPPDIRWEVLVVDNNSTDGTRAEVQGRAAAFPAPLRWVFEPRQGKAYALNTGFAASTADAIAFTDDDVLVPPDWLDAAMRPLLERPDVDYTGGPVLPSWEAPPPSWIHGDPGVLRVFAHSSSAIRGASLRKTRTASRQTPMKIAVGMTSGNQPSTSGPGAPGSITSLRPSSNRGVIGFAITNAPYCSFMTIGVATPVGWMVLTRML